MVGSGSFAQFPEEADDVRRGRSHDGRETKGTEGHDETVKFSRPVKHAIAASIGNQHIQTAAAIGKVRIGKLRFVGNIIQSAISFVVIVRIQQVVAHTAEHAIVLSSAY